MTNFWLKFYENERKLLGTPNKYQFYEIYNIMIEATDGFTYLSDSFYIKIYEISLITIIMLIF
jgi:hypothetical protein